VEHAPIGRDFQEAGQNGEVDSIREAFRQIVENQGRLVGDDGLGLIYEVSAPEREPDRILVFRNGKVAEPVESELDPRDVGNRNPKSSPALQ
jgi:hypothetical protein